MTQINSQRTDISSSQSSNFQTTTIHGLGDIDLVHAYTYCPSTPSEPVAVRSLVCRGSSSRSINWEGAQINPTTRFQMRGFRIVNGMPTQVALHVGLASSLLAGEITLNTASQSVSIVGKHALFH